MIVAQEEERYNLPLEIFRSVGRLVALWNDTVFDFLLPDDSLVDEGCSCFAFGEVLYIIALLVLRLGPGSSSMCR